MNKFRFQMSRKISIKCFLKSESTSSFRVIAVIDKWKHNTHLFKCACTEVIFFCQESRMFRSLVDR